MNSIVAVIWLSAGLLTFAAILQGIRVRAEHDAEFARRNQVDSIMTLRGQLTMLVICGLLWPIAIVYAAFCILVLAAHMAHTWWIRRKVRAAAVDLYKAIQLSALECPDAETRQKLESMMRSLREVGITLSDVDDAVISDANKK